VKQQLRRHHDPPPAHCGRTTLIVAAFTKIATAATIFDTAVTRALSLVGQVGAPAMGK
jgi:hypothetical protein